MYVSTPTREDVLPGTPVPQALVAAPLTTPVDFEVLIKAHKRDMARAVALTRIICSADAACNKQDTLLLCRYVCQLGVSPAWY